MSVRLSQAVTAQPNNNHSQTGDKTKHPAPTITKAMAQVLNWFCKKSAGTKQDAKMMNAIRAARAFACRNGNFTLPIKK